jgi:6-phosphogluconolactonase
MATGALREVCVCTDAVNATYLAKLPGDHHLFAASDRYLSPGRIECYRIAAASGELERRSSASVRGTATCHITLDAHATRAFVSSYLDAKVTVHDIEGDRVSPSVHLFEYEGKGPNAERQEAAHAHQSVVDPEGRRLYVVDLGSDRIWIHDLSALEASPVPFAVTPGYGPRHIVCHPRLPLAYLLCELNARLLVLRRDPTDGGLHHLGEHDTLPAGSSASPAGAAIRLHPSLKTLCMSNRNDDSVAFFDLDADGKPTLVKHVSTHGEEPRDFTFDPSGRWMIVANQNSNTLAVFAMDRDEPVCMHPCGSPVSILFH